MEEKYKETKKRLSGLEFGVFTPLLSFPTNVPCCLFCIANVTVFFPMSSVFKKNLIHTLTLSVFTGR
jgi:hypothetical protein